MSDNTNVPATRTGGALTEFKEQLDGRMAVEFLRVLPNTIALEKFKSVVVSAVNQNPSLLSADRRSFWNAAVRCAVDGLLPDAREAVLVSYRTKMKRRDPSTGIDRWVEIDMVQYMPMIHGIRKRMRNSGEVLSADAQVVYRNDHFKYDLGDDAVIEHKPPALDVDRGDPVGAYAIIKLKNGEVLREVMSVHEINKVRGFSRAPDSPAWKNWWSEMARVKVLRRCSKGAPMSSDLEMLLARDEPEDLDPLDHQQQPLRVGHEIPQTAKHEGDKGGVIEGLPEDERPLYEIATCDGEVIGLRSIDGATDGLIAVAEEAGRRGPDALRGMLETNELVIKQIHGTAPALANKIAAAFNEHIHRLEKLAENARSATPAQTSVQGQSGAASPADQTSRGATNMRADEFDAAVDDAERRVGTAETPTGVAWYEQTSEGALFLDVPLRGQRKDFRTWMIKFLSRLRGASKPNHLAYLLSDNDGNLEAYRVQANEVENKTLADAIAEAEKRVGAAS